MEYAREKLGISADRMMSNVHKCGNTSAASIPIVLSEAVQTGQLKRGDVLAMIGFGAGFTWASSIVKWSY